MTPQAEPHSHALRDTPEGRIRAALVLTLAVMAASVAGGLVSHSLALLSDAGHMLADAGALALALVAQRVAVRPRTHRRTYGWRRAETLAAFVNAVLLCVASLWVLGEAATRWRAAPEIRGGWMVGVAAAPPTASSTSRCSRRRPRPPSPSNRSPPCPAAGAEWRAAREPPTSLRKEAHEHWTRCRATRP